MSSSLSSRRRWVASEKIALGVLEEMGYRILEVGKKIELSGVEVGEVDVVVADSSGEIYAVEVKAGKIDVSGLRQAYVNSLLIGAKPMVICKGYADDAAKELAEKLGIKVIQLSDVFLIESEEVYTIVREVIEETLTDYLEIFYGFNPQIKQEYVEVLNAIYTSTTIEEAAEKLSLDVPTLAKKIDELKKHGVIPKWASKYSTVRRVAQILIHRRSIASALEESKRLVEVAKSLEEQFKALQNTLQALNQQVQRLATLIAKLETRAQQSGEKQE